MSHGLPDADISLLLHQSITDLPEQAFIGRLLAHPYYGSELFNIFGMPEGVVLAGGDWLDDRGRTLGDVDILKVNPAHPERALAIEVKRVKVRGERINKLHEFSVGQQRANRLADWGFALVYLYVLIVADTRAQNEGRYSYRGVTGDVRSALASAITTSGLAAGVGLVTLDFTQPMDHPPPAVGSSGLHLERIAAERPQHELATAWVRRRLQLAGLAVTQGQSARTLRGPE